MHWALCNSVYCTAEGVFCQESRTLFATASLSTCGTSPALARYSISFYQKQSGSSMLNSMQVQRLAGISFELLKTFILSACTE